MLNTLVPILLAANNYMYLLIYTINLTNLILDRFEQRYISIQIISLSQQVLVTFTVLHISSWKGSLRPQVQLLSFCHNLSS